MFLKLGESTAKYDLVPNTLKILSLTVWKEKSKELFLFPEAYPINSIIERPVNAKNQFQTLKPNNIMISTVSKITKKLIKA